MTAEATSGTILAKTAKGAGWIIGWRMVTRILGLISTLFLVRLLLPADFGLVTLAAGFGQAADSLSSLGVEEAVIREQHPTPSLYNSAFTINVIRGAISAAIVAGAAWPVGWFFNDGRLVPVMLMLAAGTLATAFENIGIVDFRRDMAFEKEFLLMSVPRAISIVVAVGLAFALHTYWALVAALLTGILLRLAMSYAMHPFRPHFELQAWRQIASFSFWSWLISLSSLARDRCDTFIIGRLLAVAEVGVFSVGVEIASLPTTEFVSPLGRACFSSFAAARHSGSETEISEAFLRVVGSTLLIALPACFGISLVADPIVKLAFGPSWLAATGVIEIFSAAAAFTIVGMISMQLLNAHAALRPIFWVQIGSVLVRVPLVMVLMSRWGLPGAAAAAGVATAIEQALYLGIALRRLQLTAADLLRHTWRCLLATALMTIGLWASGLGWVRVSTEPAAALAGLVAAVAAGAAIYATAVAGLWLAAGRPSGAEYDMIEMGRRLARRIGSALRKQRGLLQGNAG